MLATEPLPESVWAEVGLRDGETFTDHRHLIIYGQRTADDRLAFGGRGAPYHFGSGIEASFDRDERVFAELRHVLDDLFPALRGAAVTHTWGGPLGVPRDWYASVGLDADDRDGVGRRLRRRRRRDLQPRRPYPRRPAARAGHRSGPAALGRTTGRGSGSPSRCGGPGRTPACAR